MKRMVVISGGLAAVALAWCASQLVAQPGVATPTRGVAFVNIVSVFKDYKNTALAPDTPVCLKSEQGHLDHFEISVAQNKIEVYATPASADGKTFDKPTLLYSTPVDLPFTRGYVQITGRSNYLKLGQKLGLGDAFVTTPTLVLEPLIG